MKYLFYANTDKASELQLPHGICRIMHVLSNALKQPDLSDMPRDI